MSTPKFRFQIDQFLTSPIFKILSFFVLSKVTSQKVRRRLYTAPSGIRAK